MKLARKLVTLAIVLAMVMAFMIPTAMAASITVTPPALENNETEAGITYVAYKIFDASVGANGAVAYTIKSDSAYYDAVKTATNYFKLTLVAGTTDTYVVEKTDNYTKEAANTFADTLKAVKGAQSAGTFALEDGKYKLENLAEGYYLVVSSVGSDLILETLGDVNATAKNDYPSIAKTITEDTVDGGNNVNVTITVTIPEDAVGEIVVYDKMTDMQFVSSTAVTGVAVDSTPAENAGYTVAFTLSADYVNANRAKSVEIKYVAKVTAAAIANNEAWLVDGSFTSAKVSDEVLTTDILIDKFDGAAEATKLKEAKFVLMNAKENGKYYSIDADGVVSWVDEQDNATVFVTDANGAATINNVANGTYYLFETKAPVGYNPLTEAKEVTVEAVKADNDVTDIVVKVANNKGVLLPSTGGIGTTIFYVLGGVMFLGALVILFTNKRMRQN